MLLPLHSNAMRAGVRMACARNIAWMQGSSGRSCASPLPISSIRDRSVSVSSPAASMTRSASAANCPSKRMYASRNRPMRLPPYRLASKRMVKPQSPPAVSARNTMSSATYSAKGRPPENLSGWSPASASCSSMMNTCCRIVLKGMSSTPPASSAIWL